MHDSDCPFCTAGERVYITGKSWVVLEDAFPVNPGHTLIVTRRHIASFREVTADEFIELHDLLGQVTRHLDRGHTPAGYNIGINDGEAAGQTIPHVHVHVIPRFVGDCENPRGGVRKVKPPIVPY